jgi:hypothetical protein
LIGLGFVAAAVLVLAGVMISQGQSSASTTTPTVGPSTPAPTIAGVQCNPGEMLTYHVHSHLTIIVDGKAHYAPAYVGFSLNDCLYWLHTHQADGVIHIEAPTGIHPTLGAFFKVWGEPISLTRVWKYSVKPGQQMRVIVNNKLFHGNPANVVLGSHKNITIEIGPPFQPQQTYAWGNL